MAGDVEVKGTLPEQAYRPLEPGEEYDSVVPSSKSVSEFTLRAMIVGTLIGVIFGFANAYLGLKAGLTVSASIPAAVIGILVFKIFFRGNSTILETNIVQTTGSVGESLAAGVIFTLPVFLLWDYKVDFWPIFPLALFGGLLGVLFMIPLRKNLIADEHGRLPYPEGTACSEVQVAAQSQGKQGLVLLWGALFGAFHTLLEKLHLFPGEPDWPISWSKGEYRTSLGGTLSAELLGVGYIIGPFVCAVMLAGGILGWLVIIPAIYYFGSMVDVPIAPSSEMLIRDMSSWDVWSFYLRYIGAGAVAAGGLMSLVRSFPIIFSSFAGVVRSYFDKTVKEIKRTQQDMPFPLLAGLLLVITLGVTFLPLVIDKTGKGQGSLGILAGLFVIFFAFFFVTVSSRIVGLVGSSSNPISGMTIATILMCSLLFGSYFSPESAPVAVLVLGSLVCIASAVAGDTSQDLKTGFLLGATPKYQQYAEVIGVIVAALTMSTVLALFSEQIVDGTFKAPQANLIALVIKGVLGGNLPWTLIFVGAFIALLVEMMGLPTLAFAVGLYLPIHLGVPVMVGGLIRWAVENYSGKETLNPRREKGVLFCSGLIAGAALLGVMVASTKYFELSWFEGSASPDSSWLSVVAFIALAGVMSSFVWSAKKVKED